jgi:hypothetical protein
MTRLRIAVCTALLLVTPWLSSAAYAQETVVFSEDFESGQGFWQVSNGVWEIGTATAGPGSCYSGSQCAGTVLGGNYPAYEDSRMVSPLIPNIDLPLVASGEELWLEFWQWHSYSSYDSGRVQISVFDAAAGTWSAWENVGTSISGSFGWFKKQINLTSYAGEQVRIGFLHTATRDYSYNVSESTGWYIDDIQITKKVPVFTGDFGGGQGDWWANYDVWQVGTPTAGPGGCHGGDQCVGTVLNGNYPAYTDSALISAPVGIPAAPPGNPLFMTFWQWYSYSSYDSGQMRISERDPDTG